MIDDATRRRAEFIRLTAHFNTRQMDQLATVLRTMNAGGDPAPIIIDMLGEEAAAPIIAEFAANRARRA